MLHAPPRIRPEHAVRTTGTPTTIAVAIAFIVGVAAVGLVTRVPLQLVGLALGVVVVAASYLRPTGAAFVVAALAADAFVVAENVRRGAHAPGLAVHQLATFAAFVVAAAAAAAFGRSASTAASRQA